MFIIRFRSDQKTRSRKLKIKSKILTMEEIEFVLPRRREVAEEVKDRLRPLRPYSMVEEEVVAEGDPD